MYDNIIKYMKAFTNIVTPQSWKIWAFEGYVLFSLYLCNFDLSFFNSNDDQTSTDRDIGWRAGWLRKTRLKKFTWVVKNKETSPKSHKLAKFQPSCEAIFWTSNRNGVLSLSRNQDNDFDRHIIWTCKNKPLWKPLNRNPRTGWSEVPK